MEILYKSKITTVGRRRAAPDRMFLDGELGTERKKRYTLLKSISRAYSAHTWTNATLSSIGRSVIGSGWKFVETGGGSSSTGSRDLKKLKSFFHRTNRDFTNILDYMPVQGKIYQTVLSYMAFGQVAWEIVRKGGKPIGFEVISGYVEPNVDDAGNFLEPAFVVYPWDYEKTNRTIEYSADDIVYFYDPGLTGNILGESRYESLTNTSIPSDLYAAVSYRNLFKNANSPYNGVWNVDAGVNDEDFDMFVELLEQRYSGVDNYGRNPLVIRGGVEFQQTKSRSAEDAPYLEGRNYNQKEISAVSGVDSNKLGVTGQANKANMRETRREFHENTMRPLFEFFEEAIYLQVIVRLLGIKNWRIVFNRPDFMNALEQATIDMRYLQGGVYNPNEIRSQRGDPPRDGGDEYRDRNGIVERNPQDMGGNNGNGESVPQSQGKPERPPRDEENPKSLLDSMNELKAWRKHVLRSMDNKREKREFVVDSIPVGIADVVKELLDSCSGFDETKKVFACAGEAIETYFMEEENGE